MSGVTLAVAALRYALTRWIMSDARNLSEEVAQGNEPAEVDNGMNTTSIGKSVDKPVPPDLNPGSPEWGHFNHRRAWLIAKETRNQLSPDEAKELETLQRVMTEAALRAFPPPPLDGADLDAIEARLGADGAAGNRG